jgi:hypothetical protein
MIPPFDERGNLPPGIHKASWNEVEIRFGQSPKRRYLLAGLREALTSLRRAGCHTVYLNGSFTTAKEEPGDFDACWAPIGVDLKILDPLFLDFSNGRQAQKQRFGGELFPADMIVDPERIRILDFFQRERVTGQAKGIVEVNLEAGS